MSTGLNFLLHTRQRLMVFDKDESEAMIKEVNDNQFELRKQSKHESHKKWKVLFL